MDRRSSRWLVQAQQFGGRHRKSISAAVLALLGGFGVTAFGIAPLAPDAAQLPQQVLTEAVNVPEVQAQLDALAEQELSLMRSDLTRSTDTAETLLARLGVVDPSAAAFLRSDATARRLFLGRGGKMVTVSSAADGTLAELVARYPSDQRDQLKSHFTRMTLSRDAGGAWLSRVETAALEAQVRLGSGTIRSSLFASTDEAGLPDTIAIQLADIFATEIDFHRELRKGDTFSVVYESLTADGQPVGWIDRGAGRVLAAEFVNNGRAHKAVWFGDSGRGGYFGPDGASKRRIFLASPMEFSRVTSGFAMRMHPLLNRWRAHRGVDYGAPTGTEVRTVGDGVVSFSGWQNGYGNVIQIDHGNARSTLYAHLSRIEVRKGQRVEQGQHIGAVGMTGWATGPHLHFEFRINGAHQDPLRIAKDAETVPLAAQDRERFAAVARSVQSKLGIAESLAGSRPRFE